MTTLHVREMSSLAIVPREELDKLLELARQMEAVEVETQEEADLPTTREMAQLAERSAAWAWLADEPDLYSRDDLLPE